MEEKGRGREVMFVSSVEIQVAYADTDMMGVIYHANYLKWFEIGRTTLIHEIGYDYLEMEKAGYSVPVYKAELTYKKPIRYGEKVFVRTWVEKSDGLTTVYGYSVINGEGEVCAEGTTTHILVRKDNFRPVQFRKLFLEWYQKYEEIKKKT
jgi:acyl-CoA thioester hydrolase